MFVWLRFFFSVENNLVRDKDTMTGDGLFETTSIPGHLAPTPERLERLLSKQTLEELYEVEEQPFAR